MEASHEFGQIAAPTMPIADPPTDENRATKPSEENPIQPYAVQLDEAPAYWSEDSVFTLLATAEQTGGSYSLLHQVCPQNSGPAPHVHEQDEGLYILEGALTLVAGSEQFSAEAGAFLYVPGGAVHSFRIDSAQARLLNWYLPGGFEHAITGLGESTNEHSLPTIPVQGKQTPEQRKALLDRIGTTLIALPDTLRQGTAKAESGRIE